MKSDSRFIIKVLILTLQKIINAREGRVTTEKADLKRGSDLKRCVHDSMGSYQTRAFDFQNRHSENWFPSFLFVRTTIAGA